MNIFFLINRYVLIRVSRIEDSLFLPDEKTSIKIARISLPSLPTNFLMQR